MELRDLMNEIELFVEKARDDFNIAAYGACIEHLVALRELLIDLPTLEPGGACESSESSNGS